jgi:hypothetical protein
MTTETLWNLLGRSTTERIRRFRVRMRGLPCKHRGRTACARCTALSFTTAHLTMRALALGASFLGPRQPVGQGLEARE